MIVLPHPEIAPNNKIFIEIDNSWYFKYGSRRLLINSELNYYIRSIVGRIAIYDWNNLISHAAENKINTIDINNELIECPPIRIITLFILGLERWIDSRDRWIYFCNKTRKEAIPTLAKFRYR